VTPRPRRAGVGLRAGASAALLALGLLSACGGPEPPGSAAPVVASGEVADTLTALAGRFSPAYMRQDFDAIGAAYTSDAVAMSGQGPIVRGREAITDLFRLPDGVTLIHHRIVPERIRVAGDVAYDYGIYEVRTTSAEGTSPLRYGKYAVVWERGEDGRWRMAIDMWSPAPAPES
jgi:ketosteroid isomerase-like protein